MRIVVTGAKGFIGSVFCKRAIELGHEVWALDDESRGLNDVSFVGDRYVKHDCLGGFGEAVRTPVDAVVHLAALTGELQRPMEELMVYNHEMMQRVYRDALHYKAKAFVFPTTSLALGVPDSGYVISKEAALKTLLEEDRNHGIAIPLRFFNVCGEYKGLTEHRRNEVHIVYKVVEAAMRQETFVINGGDYDTVDGTPSRDFVNVLDVVEYLLFLIQRKLNGEAPITAPDGAVWLGTGALTTARQVVDIFEQYHGLLPTLVGPRRSFDCGALIVNPQQRDQFRNARGGCLIPPHISIRDEIQELMSTLCPCGHPGSDEDGRCMIKCDASQVYM